MSNTDGPFSLPADAYGYSSRLQGLQKLMPFRVREVLLVASRYDAFILEEEGFLTDLILAEYDRLNLRYAPRLNSTPSAREALRQLASERRTDMVVVTMHPGEMDPAELAREIRKRHPGLPVVLLGYDNRELQELLHSDDAAAFDEVFVWTGDARILLAIVNLIEDRHNVVHDVRAVGVEVIVLVDDSVHFVSSILPLLYGKLMRQSQRLISEGITLSHKVLRMRARPKILVAHSFEEAWSLYEQHRSNILGILTDVRFRRDGVMDSDAGFGLVDAVRGGDRDVPILMLSTEGGNVERAHAAGISFVQKDSAEFDQKLDDFMIGSFGFGPFVFRMPEGVNVGEAHNLLELRDCLASVPDASLEYHTEANHFSAWLKARTEFRLAAKLESRRASDFASIAEMRQAFIDALDEFRRQAHRDAIVDFNPDTFGTLSTFARIGAGSLGGKARGLAFLNTLLREHMADRPHEGVDVIVPTMAVIGTEMFDRFLAEGRLIEIARSDAPDPAIRQAFLEARLPARLERAVHDLVRIMDYPVAVRSSSLLEDSQHQPFAGVYETYMLTNMTHSTEYRARELCNAIKLVYASTFSAKAKAYLRATPQRPDREKMAVIIQRLIGRRHGDHFYPSFAGVAQSYNYYPFGRVKPHDGTARVALGLGKMVVEGLGGLRFCPQYPQHLPQFSTVDDVLDNAQKEFDALPLDQRDEDPHERYQPKRRPIADAITDGTIEPLASTYSHEEHVIFDGTRAGTPLVTFAPILKHNRFPLADLLSELLDRGSNAMGVPVEIEFAVDLALGPDGADDDEQRATFACLQIRPLTVMRELSRIDLGRVARNDMVCQSSRALGHGRIRNIRDVVCVVPPEFNRKESAATAADVAEINAQLQQEDRPYLLIGPGRWGSADSWLGIPVNWGQISGARIIVETGFSEVTVAPSEGSHFFHNMTAFRVAYMTTNPERGEGFIDWDWLLAQNVVRHGANGLYWIRLEEPLLGLIEGESGTGIVVKSSEVAANLTADAD